MDVTGRIEDITARIKQKVDTGDAHVAGVIAGFLPCVATSAAEAAAKFGLSDSPECYDEIDEIEAVMVLTRAFNKGLAYSVEIMPLAEARNLAASFVAEFLNASARFFTNGDWGQPKFPRDGVTSTSWSDATSATFDTGVIVISDHGTGCVWCMDED
uniref:hypothetical protein n=1 Tax=Castellaniella defragrans TaxID=75697 RepID=UPI00333EF042